MSSDFALSPTLSKLPIHLLRIAEQRCEGESESHFLPPQKKLLNSIDVVEKILLNQLRELEKTPAAIAVENQRKIRILMSMR